MSETPAPKRRWLRFSLRTLFVAVTVVAVWLGYHLNWLRQRREFLHLEDAEALENRIAYLAEIDPSRRFAFREYGSDFADKPLALSARLFLWLSGESTLQNVMVWQVADDPNKPNTTLEAKTKRARQLFPEANIHKVFVIVVPQMKTARSIPVLERHVPRP